MNEELGKFYIVVESDNGISNTFPVLDFKEDLRSLQRIAEDTFEISVPIISPWWQEKYWVAKEYLGLLKRLQVLESDSDRDKLLEKLEKIIRPYSGSSNMGNDGFCAFLGLELELAKNGKLHDPIKEAY